MHLNDLCQTSSDLTCIWVKQLQSILLYSFDSSFSRRIDAEKSYSLFGQQLLYVFKSLVLAVLELEICKTKVIFAQNTMLDGSIRTDTPNWPASSAAAINGAARKNYLWTRDLWSTQLLMKLDVISSTPRHKALRSGCWCLSWELTWLFAPSATVDDECCTR